MNSNEYIGILGGFALFHCAPNRGLPGSEGNCERKTTVACIGCHLSIRGTRIREMYACFVVLFTGWGLGGMGG